MWVCVGVWVCWGVDVWVCVTENELTMFYVVKHIDIIILLYNEHCLVLSVSDMKSIEIKRFANITRI